jgi:hypothetical protein
MTRNGHSGQITRRVMLASGALTADRKPTFLEYTYS